MKSVSVGEGSKIYTALYQQLNGDISTEVINGSYDTKSAWNQGQKYFKQRLLALIPGNHAVITAKNIS